jgi:transposase
MTAPRVGTLVAPAYVSGIDDPARFPGSSGAGACLGLAPRRHQSGEEDHAGRIPRRGDRLLRSHLSEAAGVVLRRVSRWSAPKAWGTRLAGRVGTRKATVAVARKPSVILHRVPRDGPESRWPAQEARPA